MTSSRTPATVAEARASLEERTAASQQIATDRSEILNSGLAANLEMPHALFIERGEGAYLFDADGNRYIDTSVGFGLHMLGHRHPAIQQAIVERSDKGWMFGIHSVSQLKLATLLKDASPCAERVVFCNTGTEATMYLIRAARAFSGRERIAIFDGAYHGAHDYGLWRQGPGGTPLPLGHGIPEVLKDLTLMLPYRDSAAFELVRRHRDELALVLVEGVQSSNPQRDAGPFLKELATVCRDAGVLFGIDEVITGFRVAYGGAQARFGVTADLAAYGKVLGGGLPIGAVTGRADVMEVFRGVAERNGIFSGGTFSGNPLTMEAGAAMVAHLQNNSSIYAELEARGDRLAQSINRFAEQSRLPVQMLNVGSMFQLYFQHAPVHSARDVVPEHSAAEKGFYLHALCRGVLVPGTHRAFLCAAHGDGEVDELIQVFQDSLQAVAAEGLFAQR